MGVGVGGCGWVGVGALTNERKQSNRQDVQEENVHDRAKAVHNVHQNTGGQSVHVHTYWMHVCK